jgi:hypothetical protein
MDTSWIQVFVLTISECVAPAGKTVCQEQEFDLAFLTRADCEFALEQLVTLKDESASVIVDKSKSSCAASARQSAVFASLEAVSGASPKSDGWKEPGEAAEKPASSSVTYQDRLEDLPNCEDFDGEGACKMGGIIIEAGNRGESVEVWRRDE